MNTYYLELAMPSVFFYKGYEKKSPEIYNNVLEEDFEKIYGKEYISNGLLLIKPTYSDNCLQKWSNVFMSKELTENLIDKGFLDISECQFIAYGLNNDPDWVAFDEFEDLTDKEYYSIDLKNKQKNDPIYIDAEEASYSSAYYKLCVNQDVLDIMLQFENKHLEYSLIS